MTSLKNNSRGIMSLTDRSEGHPELPNGALTRGDRASCACIAALVFVSRYLTRGGLYFVDGPRIVRAIQNHTYVIQPPGYWIYAHIGAIFHDPAIGLLFINELFSAMGAVIFFLLSRKLCLSTKTSVLTALAYSSIFFVWFAGDIQSSYASQILFAPLTIYLFFLYQNRRSFFILVLCGASYALGAGLRPSDGAFLGLLFIFMIFAFVPQWTKRIGLLFFTAVLCLAWYIPTQLALRQADSIDLAGQVGSLAFQVSPLLTGLNTRSMANLIRVVLPLVAAFWMLVPAIRFRWKSLQSRIIILWITPGLLFFLLIYMADAVYLTFLAGSVVLALALSTRERVSTLLLLLCLGLNTILFLGARPLVAHSRVDQAINFYVVKYCNYGIRHQWSSTIGTR